MIINYLYYPRITFLVLLCSLANLSACGDKTSLSNKMAVSVIKEQYLDEIYNPGIPIGSPYFNYNFKPSFVLGKDLKYKNHPRRLKYATKLENAGLLEISAADKEERSNSNLKHYYISLTSKGNKELWRKDQEMAYFKRANFKRIRVVNNTLIKDDDPNNAEPIRLVMLETIVKQTKLGNEVFGEFFEDGEANKMRIKARLKYDIFENKWYIIKLKFAFEDDDWASINL